MSQLELIKPEQVHEQSKQLVKVMFDGGCSPNPGAKYGSHQVQIDNRIVLQRHRFEFGYGTNNEAEFDSLIIALRELLIWFESTYRFPEQYHVHVLTDSMIVLNRLVKKNGVAKKPKWRESSNRMFNLACSCLEMLERFQSFTVTWQKRDHNVSRFGH